MVNIGLSTKIAERKNGRLWRGFVAVFVVLGCMFAMHSAAAASLYFSPSSGTYTVGQRFSISFGVSSADQAMNAASGVISFPGDKLQVDSISKSGSVIGLWVKDPSYAAGAVNFEGIVLNPGYTGKAAKILTINFRAKAAGTARLAFSSASVLANDGQGTSILSGTGTALITINEAEEVQPPPPVGNLPAAPTVTSSSDPDQNAWYASNAVDLAWILPSDVTGVSFGIDRKPGTVPTEASVGLSDTYSVKNAPDGVNYFHIRFQNSAGWGPTTDFKFQTDTVVPAPFTLNLLDGAQTDKARPSISWSTNDSGSGLDRYEVSIDGLNAISISAGALAPGSAYVLPELMSGHHHVSVTSVDKAGNRTTAGADFKVNTLNKPTITAYTAHLHAGEQLAIEGTTGYAGAPITVWMQKDNEAAQSVAMQADAQGNFYFAGLIPVRQGNYKVWVQAINENGVKSAASDAITVVVGAPYGVNTAMEIVLAILQIVILVVLLRHIFSKKKKNLRRPLF